MGEECKGGSEGLVSGERILADLAWKSTYLSMPRNGMADGPDGIEIRGVGTDAAAMEDLTAPMAAFPALTAFALRFCAPALMAAKEGPFLELLLLGFGGTAEQM